MRLSISVLENLAVIANLSILCKRNTQSENHTEEAQFMKIRAHNMCIIKAQERVTSQTALEI